VRIASDTPIIRETLIADAASRFDPRTFTPVAPTVVTVVQIHPRRAVFNLPRDVGANLKVGKTVRLKITDTELEVAGKVEFVAPVFDAESETLRVKALIEKNAIRFPPAAAACCCSTNPLLKLRS